MAVASRRLKRSLQYRQIPLLAISSAFSFLVMMFNIPLPGGTTGLDFFLAGHNKGVNVAHFIDRQKWNKEDCLYVGDALFPGGNDACVIGVIPTHAVGGPDETFEYIQECLLR